VADTERLLVSKVISTGEFIDIIDAKITEEFFMDEEHRHVFRWARKHWATYGTGPASQAILRERPTYKLTEDTPEPIAYYIKEVWKQYSATRW